MERQQIQCCHPPTRVIQKQLHSGGSKRKTQINKRLNDLRAHFCLSIYCRCKTKSFLFQQGNLLFLCRISGFHSFSLPMWRCRSKRKQVSRILDYWQKEKKNVLLRPKLNQDGVFLERFKANQPKHCFQKNKWSFRTVVCCSLVGFCNKKTKRLLRFCVCFFNFWRNKKWGSFVVPFKFQLKTK